MGAGEGKFIITAQNRIKEGLDPAKQDLLGFEDAAKHVGDTLKNALTVTAIVAGLKKLGETAFECFKEFGESERRLNSLKIALDNNETSFGRMTGLIGDMHKMSLASKDDIEGLVAELAMLGKSDKEIEAITKASVNLSNVTGKDLNSAFTLINGTYMGTAGKLEKLIPEIGDLSKKQLEAGEATDLINTKFGEMSAALAKNDISQGLKNIKDSWGELRESLGEAVAPIFTPILQGLQNIVDGWNDAFKAHKNYIQMSKKLTDEETKQAVIDQQEIVRKQKIALQVEISNLQNSGHANAPYTKLEIAALQEAIAKKDTELKSLAGDLRVIEEAIMKQEIAQGLRLSSGLPTISIKGLSGYGRDESGTGGGAGSNTANKDTGLADITSLADSFDTFLSTLDVDIGPSLNTFSDYLKNATEIMGKTTDVNAKTIGQDLLQTISDYIVSAQNSEIGKLSVSNYPEGSDFGLSDWIQRQKDLAIAKANDEAIGRSISNYPEDASLGLSDWAQHLQDLAVAKLNDDLIRNSVSNYPEIEDFGMSDWLQHLEDLAIAKADEEAGKRSVSDYPEDTGMWLADWLQEQKDLAISKLNEELVKQSASNYPEEGFQLLTPNDLRPGIQAFNNSIGGELSDADISSGMTDAFDRATWGLNDFSFSISDSMGIILDALGPFGNMIAGMNPALALLMPSIKGFVDVIGPAFTEALEPITQTLTSLGQTLGSMLLPVLDAISPVFALLGETLQTVLLPVIQLLTPALQIVASLFDVLTPILKLVAQAFTIIMAPVEYVADLFSWVGEWIKTLGTNIGVFVYNLSHWFNPKDYVSGPGSFVSDAFSGLADKLAAIDLIGGTSLASAYSTSTQTATESAAYRTQNITINIYQEAPIVGSGGMTEFARMIRGELESLAYYGT